MCRTPQSVQSAPYEHSANSAPGPPSSHSPSLVQEHSGESWHICGREGGAGGSGGGGDGAGSDGGGDGMASRGPQSEQSVA